jgi:hypothetical protein
MEDEARRIAANIALPELLKRNLIDSWEWGFAGRLGSVEFGTSPWRCPLFCSPERSDILYKAALEAGRAEILAAQQGRRQRGHGLSPELLFACKPRHCLAEFAESASSRGTTWIPNPSAETRGQRVIASMDGSSATVDTFRAELPPLGTRGPLSWASC